MSFLTASATPQNERLRDLSLIELHRTLLQQVDAVIDIWFLQHDGVHLLHAIQQRHFAKPASSLRSKRDFILVKLCMTLELSCLHEIIKATGELGSLLRS